MIIRNHLRENVVLNIYNKNQVTNINDINNYRLDGIQIPARSTSIIETTDDDILYFANIPMTKLAKVQVQFVDSEIIDLWTHASDIVKCHQLPMNDGVDCKDSENIVMKWKLPNHIIFKLYNSTTYIAVLLLFSLLIITLAFIVIKHF